MKAQGQPPQALAPSSLMASSQRPCRGPGTTLRGDEEGKQISPSPPEPTEART